MLPEALRAGMRTQRIEQTVGASARMTVWKPDSRAIASRRGLLTTARQPSSAVRAASGNAPSTLRSASALVTQTAPCPRASSKWRACVALRRAGVRAYTSATASVAPRSRSRDASSPRPPGAVTTPICAPEIDANSGSASSPSLVACCATSTLLMPARRNAAWVVSPSANVWRIRAFCASGANMRRRTA